MFKKAFVALVIAALALGAVGCGLFGGGSDKFTPYTQAQKNAFVDEIFEAMGGQRMTEADFAGFGDDADEYYEQYRYIESSIYAVVTALEKTEFPADSLSALTAQFPVVMTVDYEDPDAVLGAWDSIWAINGMTSERVGLFMYYYAMEMFDISEEFSGTDMSAMKAEMQAVGAQNFGIATKILLDMARDVANAYSANNNAVINQINALIEQIIAAEGFEDLNAADINAVISSQTSIMKDTVGKITEAEWNSVAKVSGFFFMTISSGMSDVSTLSDSVPDMEAIMEAVLEKAGSIAYRAVKGEIAVMENIVAQNYVAEFISNYENFANMEEGVEITLDGVEFLCKVLAPMFGSNALSTTFITSVLGAELATDYNDNINAILACSNGTATEAQEEMLGELFNSVFSNMGGGETADSYYCFECGERFYSEYDILNHECAA